MPTPKIAPSMLSSDFSNLANEAQKMIDYKADYLHMDIMDGHFVPNLTIGSQVVKSLRMHHKNVFLDCHLMVSEPEKVLFIQLIFDLFICIVGERFCRCWR